MAVYAIQAGEDGPIKIGSTNNLMRRLSKLRTSSPTPLYLVAAFEGGSPEEAALHTRFARQRLSGEWFSISREAVFDIDLPRIAASGQRSARDRRGELRNPVSHVFRKWLELHAMSPSEFAERHGFDLTLVRWWLGGDWSRHSLERLAKATGLTVQDFLLERARFCVRLSRQAPTSPEPPFEECR